MRELTKSALSGFEPELKVFGAGPITVCFGAKLVPENKVFSAPNLEEFFQTVNIPTETNFRLKAVKSLGTMLGNNAHPNCTIVGAGHAVGVWSANDKDSSGEILMTETEAVSQFKAIAGPNARGAYMPYILNHWLKYGLIMSKKTRKIDGWVKVKHKNHELVKTAIYQLGGLQLILKVPKSFLSNDIWKYSGPTTIATHNVAVVDYVKDGLVVSSWGRLYKLLWEALDYYGRECYAVLSPSWYGKDNLSPVGFKTDELKIALKNLI